MTRTESTVQRLQGQQTFGQSPPRVEDLALLTGRGRFTDDIRFKDTLYAAFCRSSEAHGRIKTLDIGAASQAGGVVAVFTGRDVAGLGLASVNALTPEIDPLPPRALAEDTVCAVGAPIAMVIAARPTQAIDAAERIEAEIDPLPTNLPQRLDGPIRARETWIASVEGHTRHDSAVHAAVSLRQSRLAPVSLEPRTIVADAGSTPGLMTIWLGTQSPHRIRDELAAILGIRRDAVRVIAPDVGGAFGMKASLYPEDIAVAWAAWSLGRCIKWISTRGEEFLSATQGRGHHIDASLTASADGRLLDLDARVRAPLGHWMPFSAVVPTRNAGRIMPGPYRVESVNIEATGHTDHGASVGIYRGAGRPEAALTMELLLDRLATALEMPPAELRLRNLVAPDDMPWRTLTGQLLDSGRYAEALNRAESLLSRQGIDSGSRRLRGSASICYIEPSGTGWETARLKLCDDGTFEATTGSTTQGQGRTTTVGQIVSAQLGISADLIRVCHGNSSAPDTAIGALASRSTPIGGSALDEACSKLKAKAAEKSGRDPVASMDWQEVARNVGPLTVDTCYKADGEAWGYGAVGCRIAIDPETGVLEIERLVWIDDAGTIINPVLAKGQLMGGVAQGIGEALLERIIYDEDGQLLTGSLMDYGIPRADDMPPIQIEQLETPSSMNRLGAKGIGEAGTIGAPAAIACAVMDAVRPVGVKHLDMPYTPARVWKAIQDARQSPSGKKPGYGTGTAPADH